jgi:cell division protein ZapA (FtsZ GTPase activity inhibitor)
MQSVVSIKVEVAGILLPMSVLEAQSSDILAIAQELNQKIGRMQEQYAVKDLATVLAMVSLEMANNLYIQSKQQIDLQKLQTHVEQLELLSKQLSA